jgi:hypothetical protein
MASALLQAHLVQLSLPAYAVTSISSPHPQWRAQDRTAGLCGVHTTGSHLLLPSDFIYTYNGLQACPGSSMNE